MFEIFIIKSLIKEKGRSGWHVNTAEGEVWQWLSDSRHRLPLTLEEGLLRGEGGEVASPEGLNVEKARGQRPPEAENLRIVAMRRLGEEDQLRKNFCLQMGKT